MCGLASNALRACKRVYLCVGCEWEGRGGEGGGLLEGVLKYVKFMTLENWVGTHEQGHAYTWSFGHSRVRGGVSK